MTGHGRRKTAALWVGATVAVGLVRDGDDGAVGTIRPSIVKEGCHRAVHGAGGTGQDMAETATRLTGEGFLVFAPAQRTELSTQQGSMDAVVDAEGGYRFARSIAADYGGDLDQPVSFVGWSLGATVVLAGGLTESPEFVACFTKVPRADVIVAISGCYYECEGAKFNFDPSGWGNKDADVVLVAGRDVTVCAAWQSEDAAAALRSAGCGVDPARGGQPLRAGLPRPRGRRVGGGG